MTGGPGEGGVRPPDRSRWRQVSPLLDELDALTPAERQARLVQIRAEDSALADELDAWLREDEALQARDFMAAPALPTPTAPASLAGRVMGAYTLERELGQGGMGSVWLAHRNDGRYEGQVAVKCLRAGLLARGDVERFEREGRLLARLQHPNIARLIDAGLTPDDSQPFLVLEHVQGVPIDVFCREQALGVPACLALFQQVLAAVAHAHSRLILHRDLKPSNVLVTPAGEVKLLDFGIGRLLGEADEGGADSAGEGDLTRRVGRAYTLRYAAPEQVEGGEMSTATDVHALGVLLFLLLSGQHPVREATSRSGSTLEAMRAVVEADPGRVSQAAAQGPGGARRARELRGDLDLIVAKALQKQPALRYANAAEMSEDIARHLARQPIAARQPAVGHQLLRFVQRHRLGVAAGTAVLLALSVGIGLALHEGREAARQQARAEGLIEFMLSDLPARLRPVGRLDALDAVGERALAHYAAQDPGALDTDALGRRARALHLIGEIASRRGQLERAAQIFEQASQSTAELLARYPDEGQRLFDHAQSAFWVGQVARQRGQVAPAEAAFLQYLALSRRLAALPGASLEWRMEVPFASETLGVIYLDAWRLPQAMAMFEVSLQTWRELAPQRPELFTHLANAQGWVAVVQELRGNFQGGIEALRQKREALRQMPDAAQNRAVQEQQAVAAHETGRLTLCLGQAAAAVDLAQQARALSSALVAHDSSNMEWLGQWALAGLGLGEAELAQGQARQARATLASVSQVLPRLLAADGERARWQLELRGKWLQLRAELAAGVADAGLAAELDRYLADMAARETAGRALNGYQQQVLAGVLLARGDVARASGQAEAAARWWQQAAARVQAQAGQGDLAAMAVRAQALLRAGGSQEAQGLVDKLAASAYRHPRVLALLQARGPSPVTPPGS